MPAIQVRIPYATDGNLGAEYNRIVAASAEPWILFLDHDVLLLNPHWHLICQRAIADHPAAGLFTCLTNRIGGPKQQARGCPPGDDILLHRRFAKELFSSRGFSCTRIPGKNCSGMLLLVSKAAHAAAGGFPGKGLFGEDWGFGRRLDDKGIDVMRMDGLYVYHVKDRTDGSWIQGQKTSKEIWAGN